MTILYQIALGITAFGAAVIAFNIILKKTKTRTRFDIFYGLLACSLIIWAVGRYGLLITNQYNIALFWVHLLYFGSILVHVFFLHVILIFLDIENKRKAVLIIFYINAIFLLILNSIDFIGGSNYFIKDVIPKLSFNYYEEPNIFYNLHLINYIFIPFYALFEMILALRNSTYEKKQQLKLIIFSSILGFFGGNSVVPLVYNIRIEPFLLILVPFHLLTLAYAITKHHLFNIKTIATELLTFAIWIAVLFELLIADTWKERIFEGGLLLFVIVFGILLIKSVLKEVHQREQMEKLSKELEKLNSQLSIRTQQLTSLKDFTTSLIKTLDFKEIIQIIVNGIVERFNYAGVFLTGITEDNKYLYPLAISQNKPVELALKLLPKKLEEYREPIENNPSLVAQTIQTNSIQINEDFGKFFSVVPEIMLRGMQALIGFKSVLA